MLAVLIQTTTKRVSGKTGNMGVANLTMEQIKHKCFIFVTSKLKQQCNVCFIPIENNMTFVCSVHCHY